MGVSLMIYFYDRINTTDKKSRKRIRQSVLRKVLSRADRKQQLSLSEKTTIVSQKDRDLLKEHRRKRMIPFMAMKKPMYDNILMKCPRGDVLSTVSLKKANWYIRKNLAEWETSAETSIRLLFQPNTNRSIDTEQTRLVKYNQSIKQNCCVACGCDKDYRRHYIVPYAYRARFPPEFKTHMPHDVVILCPTCHVRAQTAAQTRMHALEDELRRKLTDPNVDSCHATFLDPTIQTTRSAASALLKRKAQLPPEKVMQYDQVVRAYYKMWSDDDGTQLTEEQLQWASRLEPRCPNPHFVSGPDLLERELLQTAQERGMENVIMDFVKEWRYLFQRTVQPQFLPSGWSLDSPVRCDSRSSSN
jgi:hypothetical protein